ncbi:MAG: hypothetical protein NC321_03420 [Clostridium sp.]|nr:hypothetical protein [Clostridium sp.]
MQSLKEIFKRNAILIKIYQTVFNRLYKLKMKAIQTMRRMKNRLKVQTRFCYGDKNKDKIFFVISYKEKNVGLYSTIFYMLDYINYAVKRKYIPVIDLSNSYLPMIQDANKVGKENPWEYYYEQPIKQYTLEEVYQSQNVIVLADYVFNVKKADWKHMFPADKKEYQYYSQLIRSYIKLNHELESRVKLEKKRIFTGNQRILGVGVRAGLRAGAMRNEKLYNNHPKQPSCEELMDIIEEKMKQWNCDALFLSCDDREYSNKFIARFGSCCYYINRKLNHFFENDKPVDIDKIGIEYAQTTVQEKTKEYVTEVYILAQCHCLYSCKGGGNTFAYFQNGGKYEHIEVYDKGYYSELEK